MFRGRSGYSVPRQLCKGLVVGQAWRRRHSQPWRPGRRPPDRAAHQHRRGPERRGRTRQGGVARGGGDDFRRRHDLHRPRRPARPATAAGPPARTLRRLGGAVNTPAGAKPIVLAYSGGLDTSFLVPWIAEHHQRPVITVTVDTGGIDAAAALALRERALALCAISHHQIDARTDYFEQVLRFLIMGNVRLGQLHPLCVGAERAMQAQTIALMARRLGSDSIAHWCTAAGNDQVRFEVALRTLAPELEIIAPVRDRAFRRQEELEYLRSRQLPVPPYGAAS